MTSVLFVSDAWRPQVNGVVRTIEATCTALAHRGIRTEIISPQPFRSLGWPGYPEIRLSLATARRVGQMIDAADCTHVHIATEGPLGMAAAAALRRRGRRFTTCYHTRFPEYLAARMPVPRGLSHAVLRRFHGRGAGCMVATPSLRDELAAKGYRSLMMWPRGVDTDLFRPQDTPDAPPDPFAGLPRPMMLYVGRLAVEKNLPAFLGLPLPGTKVLIGDGPDRDRLRRAYPDAVFTGAQSGAALARCFAAADVFVFPSRTDTFGMVLLESLACGTPVAAFPVMGPRDVITHGVTGALDQDLGAAVRMALTLPRAPCRAAALRATWAHCTDIFLENLRRAETGA